MKLANAILITEWLQQKGRNAKLDKSYSGRGMFGETTAAVIADHTGDVYEAKGALGIEEGFREDTMGYGAVVY